MPMTRVEAAALWAEVKANAKRLVECAGPHTFIGDETDVQSTLPSGEKIYRRFVCTKCGGKAGAFDRAWYERGLEHGRKERK